MKRSNRASPGHELFEHAFAGVGLDQIDPFAQRPRAVGSGEPDASEVGHPPPKTIEVTFERIDHSRVRHRERLTVPDLVRDGVERVEPPAREAFFGFEPFGALP